ncbi:MICOS complex subunit MIC10-like [Cimex lectularius]|uniref:MICOS complex subunit MIC10 n=1 Tax=Cimex lectularius TaxID=79782 RepID=A0A8I6S4H4_CIMLE|nr:MICOS complex subunit MIC10-like [Cimex lectularius]
MSEAEDVGPRWDKCIAHAIKSITIGTALGLVASTLIFKRKRWAFLLGVGYGMGVALSGCEYEVNQRDPIPYCEDESKKPKGK